MSVFQGLSAGNGRKPLRLAPWPVLMALQALGPPRELTWRFALPEVALPGLGFVTVTAKRPGVLAVPVATSWVEEAKVEVREEEPSFTCALETKLLPVRVIEKLPVLIEVGWMLLRVGIGFKTFTVTEALREESAVRTALRVTAVGFGRDEGAS